MTAGRSSVKPAIFASFAGYASADVKAADSDAQASFGLIGVRVLPMLEWQASSDVTACFGLGGGGDWIHVTAEGAPPDGAVGGGSATLEAIGSALLGARVRLSARTLSALFALDADVDLTRHSYVTTSPGSAAFFEPSRVRPMGLAGLALSFGNSVVAPSSLQQPEDRR